MNAVNTLMREQAESEFEAAVTAANRWTALARPIIQASIELDRTVADTLGEIRKLPAEGNGDAYLNEQTYREAMREVEKARDELEKMLDGIRSNFVADNSKTWFTHLTEDEGAAVDEWNDALEREVIGVNAFVKVVEREDYDAWLGRAHSSDCSGTHAKDLER